MRRNGWAKEDTIEIPCLWVRVWGKRSQGDLGEHSVLCDPRMADQRWGTMWGKGWQVDPLTPALGTGRGGEEWGPFCVSLGDPERRVVIAPFPGTFVKVRREESREGAGAPPRPPLKGPVTCRVRRG